MNVFKIKKNIAGKKAQKLSFDLILIIMASNINSASPPDDINKIGLKNKPTTTPMAPSISRIITTIPIFFSLNRSNSVFI